MKTFTIVADLCYVDVYPICHWKLAHVRIQQHCYSVVTTYVVPIFTGVVATLDKQVKVSAKPQDDSISTHAC